MMWFGKLLLVCTVQYTVYVCIFLRFLPLLIWQPSLITYFCWQPSLLSCWAGSTPLCLIYLYPYLCYNLMVLQKQCSTISIYFSCWIVHFQVSLYQCKWYQSIKLFRTSTKTAAPFLLCSQSCHMAIKNIHVPRASERWRGTKESWGKLAHAITAPAVKSSSGQETSCLSNPEKDS